MQCWGLSEANEENIVLGEWGPYVNNPTQSVPTVLTMIVACTHSVVFSNPMPIPNMNKILCKAEFFEKFLKNVGFECNEEPRGQSYIQLIHYHVENERIVNTIMLYH